MKTKVKITKDVTLGSKILHPGDEVYLHPAELDIAQGSYSETSETKEIVETHGPIKPAPVQVDKIASQEGNLTAIANSKVEFSQADERMLESLQEKKKAADEWNSEWSKQSKSQPLTTADLKGKSVNVNKA